MATQADAGITLTYAHDGRGYKLIELPPEVLELLESENPPTLTLHPSPTAALLKTPSKTYSLRQKNTSNALMIISPTSNTGKNIGEQADNPDAAIAAAAQGALSIIATMHDTVELLVEADEAAAGAPKPRGKWHEKFARGR